MIALRTSFGLNLLIAALACGGCETPEQSGGATKDSKTPTAKSSVGLTAKASDSDPLAEYGERKKTWCDERPVEVIEDLGPDGKPVQRYESVMNEQGEYVRHGLSTTWWATGQKKLEMYYVCGVKHGPKKTWWQDGKRWSVGGFIDGKDHGTWTVWSPEGLPTKEFRLVKGVWQGPFTLWHPTGEKKLEVEFVDGVQQGMMTIWDDKGNLLKKIEYLDGREQPMPGA